MKYLINIFMFLFFLASFSEEKLTIITEDYPPLNYVENNEVKGPVVDIVKEIEKRVGTNEEIQVYPWMRAFETVKEKKNTVLFSIARTEEREKDFKWVGPIAIKKYKFYAKRTSDISVRNLDDLKKYIIGVQKGGVNEEMLLKYGFDKVARGEGGVVNYEKLRLDRIDLWFVGASSFEYIIKKKNVNRDDFVDIFTLEEKEMYIAFNKETNDEIVEKWRKNYSEMKSEGFVDEIYKKYNMEYLKP